MRTRARPSYSSATETPHAAIGHFSNISHLIAPIMATASVTGEVLGTPNATMKEQPRKGEPKLFTPWMAM